jgi:hypothetical protein
MDTARTVLIKAGMLNDFYPLRNAFIVCVKIHIKPEISDAINTAEILYVDV